MPEKKASPSRVIVKARLSYVFVAEPRPDDEKVDKDTGKPLYYYSLQLVIPKSDKANMAKLQGAVKAAIAKKFGADKVAAAMKNPNFKKPLRDADAEGREGAEYKGTAFANCKTNAKGATDYASRPGIMLKTRVKLTDVAEIGEHIYSGCTAYVSVTAYYFKNSGSQGIALGLNNILKDADGERLDGSIDADAEFADLFEEGADGFDELDDGLDGDDGLGGDDLDDGLDFDDDIPF